MPNGMYGGVRGRRTKVGRKLLRFPPTRLEGRGLPWRQGKSLQCPSSRARGSFSGRTDKFVTVFPLLFCFLLYKVEFVRGRVRDGKRRVFQDMVHFIFEVADFAPGLWGVVKEVFPQDVV